MTGTAVAHPGVEERKAVGKQVRLRVPLSVHAGWTPASDRPDPVGLLEEQNRTRDADLVPVRHGRMVVSPFTFYRGTAKIMAAYLGRSDKFDRSISDFAQRYAEQNDRDYEEFVEAVRSGRLEAREGL